MTSLEIQATNSGQISRPPTKCIGRVVDRIGMTLIKCTVRDCVTGIRSGALKRGKSKSA
jgi:hypothetical protein